MDVRLKIGAVFSLAGNEAPSHDHPSHDEPSVEPPCNIDCNATSNEHDSPNMLLLTDHVGNPEHESQKMPMLADQWPTDDPIVFNPAVDEPRNIMTSLALSDQEAPPSLQLEGTTGSIIPDLDTSTESMPPPVLQPEYSSIDTFTGTSLEEDLAPPLKKLKCSKIDPCYIVLTNINNIVQENGSIGCRTLKKVKLECTNMCKKMHFKRQLKRGKDVFNVKTPSKQKDYLVYLRQYDQETKHKSRPERKTGIYTALKDLLKKHDKIVMKRKRSPNKKYFPRIRRNVSHVPTDFKEVASRKQELVEDEIVKPKCTVDYDAQLYHQHKRELESLKKLVQIKRRNNKKLKKIKKATLMASPLDIADGTKSLSGRVRKNNKKYEDYATNRYELNAYFLMHRTNHRIKREKQKKNQKQSLSKKCQEYQTNTNASTNLSEADSDSTENNCDKSKKRIKADPDSSFKIDIDNAETGVASIRMESIEHKTKVEKKTKKKSKRKKQPATTSNEPFENEKKTEKKLLDYSKSKNKNQPPTPSNELITQMKLWTEESITEARTQMAHKKKKLCSDGVLIQDMPTEDNVIHDLLQTPSKPSNKSQSMTETRTEGHREVAFTKSLLNQNLSPKFIVQYETPVKIKSEPVDNSYEQEAGVSQVNTTQNITKQTLDDDKFKLFKIPESVQRLFKSEISTTQMTNVTNMDVKTNTSNKLLASYTPSSSTSVSSPLTTSQAASMSGLLQAKCIRVVTQKGSTGGRLQLNAMSLVTPNQGAGTHGYDAQYRKQDPHPISLFANKNPDVGSKPASKGISTKPQHTLVTLTGGISQCTRPFPTVACVNRAPVQTVSNQMTIAAMGKTVRPTGQQQLVPVLISPDKVTNGSQSLKQTHTFVTADASPIRQVQQPVTTAVQETIVHPAILARANMAINRTQMAQNRPQTAVMPGPTDKNKFYLLKIEGKNILVPIESSVTPPKAYVVNSKTDGSGVASSTVASATNSQMLKPTAAITPSVKSSAPSVACVSVVCSAAGMTAVSASSYRLAQTPVSLTTTQTLTKPAPVGTQLKHHVLVPPFVSHQSRAVTDSTATLLKQKITASLKPNSADVYVPVGHGYDLQSKPAAVEENTTNQDEIADDTSKARDASITSPETPANKPESPKAFAEAVTAREERLRRLKELLKQKQKAVDEIRIQKT